MGSGIKYTWVDNEGSLRGGVHVVGRAGGFRTRHTWVPVLALPLISSNSVEIVMCPPLWVCGGSVYHETLHAALAGHRESLQSMW